LDGAWQQLIRNKYLGSKSITQITKQLGDSQFWRGLMNVKEGFLNFRSFQIQDGRVIRFWEDSWLGATTLKEQYPKLYNIVRRKDAMVAEILGLQPFNISFRKSLVTGNLHDWHDLVLKLSSINLTDFSDHFKWSLNSNDLFSVNSMYQTFLDTNVVPNNIYLWKIKVPLKIKVFL
jgi:hypothetical protein